MSKDAKNVPALRFKGYSDAWEKRKLGDVVERVTRKNRDLVSTRPLTISAQDGLVDQRKFFSKTVASKNISNYFLLKAGDFAYNKSYSVGYPWGAVKRLDKYPSGVLSTLYIVFKPKKINSQFLVTYFEGTTWYVSVSKVASEGARNHGLLNISASDFFDQQLFFPTKKTEQESIGFTIKVLDDLIAATQYSIDALEQAKKALLQRLFDQSWRFKGHSDPWEKRKSKALFSPSSQKGRPNLPVVSVTQDSGVVFRDKMDINIDYDRSTLGSYKVVKPGDFIISLRSFQGGFELSDKVGITSPAYTIFNFKKPEEHFSDFWKYLFKRYLFVQSLKSVTFGIRDGRSISFKDFSDLNIIFPSSKKEEETISRLLGLIDDLIAATQSRLSSLELLKKSLLQDLFI